jgi:hypothetical protein
MRRTGLFRHSVRPPTQEVALPLRFAFLISALIPVCLQAGVLATGTFKSKDSGIQAAGSFEIVENAGKISLMIKSDFKVSDGPDLYFAFNPLAAAKVTGDNAKTNALRIAKLKSLSGAQSYDLPADFDLDKYPTLVVHCWQYNHLYAAGVVTKSAAASVARRLPGADRVERPKLAAAEFGIVASPDRRAAYDLSGKELTGLRHRADRARR